MTDNTNSTNQVTDNRFSSCVSNCPSVTERFTKELISHNDEMNMFKFDTRFSASDKAKAFKSVYEKMDKSKFYSISADSLVKLLSIELSSVH